MSDARDDLVDVIAEALIQHEWRTVNSAGTMILTICTCGAQPIIGEPDHIASAVLAALVERYGEPEIEHEPLMVHPMDLRPKTYLRRLVFPWKAVKEGT